MYIRRIVSEERREDLVVRRYEVETPHWVYEDSGWLGYSSKPFERLFILELRMTPVVATYFARVPYQFADSIVHHGFQPLCSTPFCCCDWDVLYYPMEPVVRSVTDFETYRGGPIVLAVAAEDEHDLLYGGEPWPTPRFGFGGFPPRTEDKETLRERMIAELRKLAAEEASGCQE